MIRSRLWTVLAGVGAAAAVAVAPAARTHAQDANKWVTIKGQVVFPAGKPIPERQKIDIKADKEHCSSKGDLYNEALIINPKDRGVKNVWVYLAKGDIDPSTKRFKQQPFGPSEINSDLAKAPPKEHAIDQPTCQFVPRVTAARQGDTIAFKNSAPVPHNVRFTADDDALTFNQTLPPGGQYKPAQSLKAQRGPITIKCDIHPWMEGRVVVFDHPYFAVTDVDGKFEIKNAPAGKYRIFYRHENGFHKGREGAGGFPIEIAAGANGAMELKPIELELPAQ